MKKDHPLLNEVKDDLTIINALKLINTNQKKDVLEKIKALDIKQENIEINPSSYQT